MHKYSVRIFRPHPVSICEFSQTKGKRLGVFPPWEKRLLKGGWAGVGGGAFAINKGVSTRGSVNSRKVRACQRKYSFCETHLHKLASRRLARVTFANYTCCGRREQMAALEPIRDFFSFSFSFSLSLSFSPSHRILPSLSGHEHWGRFMQNWVGADRQDVAVVHTYNKYNAHRTLYFHTPFVKENLPPWNFSLLAGKILFETNKSENFRC